MVDYGIKRLLLHRRTPDEIAKALFSYLLTFMPEPAPLPAAQRQRMLAWAAPHIADLLARASSPLIIDVPPGLLVNRIGALDGFLVYPADTSFEARSLPPDAVSQPLHTFVTTSTIRMEAYVTPPWFGRPGGGLRLGLVEAGMGLRDMVRESRMDYVV